MSSTDLVLLVVAIATAAVMLSPPLLRSRDWRATVTPLASIIVGLLLLVAAEDVRLPQRGHAGRGQGREDGIPGVAAVMLVDGVEVIDVQNNNSDFMF